MQPDLQAQDHPADCAAAGPAEFQLSRARWEREIGLGDEAGPLPGAAFQSHLPWPRGKPERGYAALKTPLSASLLA